MRTPDMAWMPPPKAVMAPHALFRLLTMAPRPSLAIDKAKAGLGDVRGSFTVVGLTSHEWAEADGDRAELLVRSVRMNGEPAFLCADDVGTLPITIADALLGEVMNALAIVSPMQHLADFAEWRTVLCVGARHPTNHTTLNALGRAYDIFTLGNSARSSNRPDRYFGVPQCALTDGQWMATEAARAVIEEGYRK